MYLSDSATQSLGRGVVRLSRIAAAASVALLAGCASAPKAPDDSAVALAKTVSMQSVPLAGMAVQALMGGGTDNDLGTYRTNSQRWCAANAGSTPRALEKFAELCGRKGGSYDGRFCTARSGVEEVLFLANFDQKPELGCLGVRLLVAEPKSAPADPAWISYLEGQGYRRVAQREREQNVLRTALQVQAERQAAAESVRLAVELPQLKKRGTKVCKVVGPQTFVGFVEDFTDEKVKVLVTQGFMTNSPGVGLKIDSGTLTWDPFTAWRLC